MFEGGLVKLDADGLAAVTLDFACLQCHQNRTVQWAAPWADNIHQDGLTAIGDLAEVPTEFILLQNYPNPFNPETTIEYQLPKTARVRLAVYNVLGQEVAVLVKGVRPPGTHKVVLDARNLPSGLYVYRLEADELSFSKKMLVVR